MRPPELLQRVWWTETLPTHPFWTEVPRKMVLFHMTSPMVNCLVTQWAISFPIRLPALWLNSPLLHTNYTGRKTCLLFSWDQLRFWIPSTWPSTHVHLNSWDTAGTELDVTTTRRCEGADIELRFFPWCCESLLSPENGLPTRFLCCCGLEYIHWSRRSSCCLLSLDET